MPKRIENVGCPYCGVCCDDLVVTVSDDGKKILEVENACAIGNQIYHHATDSERVKLPRLRQPDGTYKEISYDEAIDYAARVLYNARKPLIYGFGSTNCEGMAAAAKVGEKAGAILDNCASICHGSSLLAIFDNGYPSCTLGEVKNRADVILYWGANPAHAHPRHMSRYSIFPRGFFTGKGHKSRKIIVIDPRYTDTARVADIYLQVKQGYDYDLFDAFRTVVRGHEIPEEVAGIKREKIHEVAEIMKNARFGTIFYGMGLCHTDGRNHNIDIAISLTRDLNDFTKWTIMAMRGHYNITGPNQVWSWQYGFPYCLDLSKRDIAHMNPGETSSIDLAMRGEIDAFFNVATDAGAHFPIAAVKELRKHPWITIDPNICMASEISDLHIPVGVVGVEVPGIVYRMDNVPIQYRKVIDPPEGVISDEELFERIYQRLCDLEAEDAAKERAKTTPEGVPAED
ncbi:MAG: formylmethanofuran dehydrogenase subunit B [Methanoculleus sp.]|nr:formylmethanofuran dehydrogenase subunit B [Methanoculleus sp.]HOB07276.1 formylmethanofuran dehydrogenase subunit B [Methanoculleus sp.]HOD86098.1 formylmethanofuran dehydrogenase subunit B [Methanoculleus sp.]HPD51725.1 formylmethanofuran dehydrogenase subunit B [Methanoculleus sp.]HPZ32892.1 formylmethanofuran dehydrogenase subunit B [Methanoculleus sp.]